MLELLLATVLLASGTPPLILTAGEGSMHWIKSSNLPRNGWYGLFDDDKNRAYLRRTRITILKEEPLSGGSAITVDSVPGGAFVLFHGVPAISEHEVTPALWDDPNVDMLRSGEEVRLHLGKRLYTIVLHESGPSHGTAEVELRDGERSQTLFRMSGSGDGPHCEILWAGDLDGDGKLDLLVTLSDKYSAFPRQLLLSGSAHKGELVHEVAHFNDVSC